MRLVVGISGASGSVYAIRALEALRQLGVETHLVVSAAAADTMMIETSHTPKKLASLAAKSYKVNDIAAKIASGSFKTDGMLVIPCSMKTLAGIASGYSDNLLLRAADVTLKERRPLVLVVRETPLSAIHLENMLRVSRAGGVILPAMPSFYRKPSSVGELVDQIVGKALDIFGLEHDLYRRWEGGKRARGRVRAIP